MDINYIITHIYIIYTQILLSINPSPLPPSPSTSKLLMQEGALVYNPFIFSFNPSF